VIAEAGAIAKVDVGDASLEESQVNHMTESVVTQVLKTSAVVKREDSSQGKTEPMVHLIKTDKSNGTQKEDNFLAYAGIHNKYIGTEWTLPNGLKVTVRQGDLVNEISYVIVNPENPDLQHGAGTARAIARSAGT